VKIKVTLGPHQVQEGLRAFSLDEDKAHYSRFWFCEYLKDAGGPAALPLLARGIIIRVREHADQVDDATMTLRGPEGVIDQELWRQRTRPLGQAARIEGEWMADRHLVSASLIAAVKSGRIQKVAAQQPSECGACSLTRRWRSQPTGWWPWTGWSCSAPLGP